MKRGIDPERQAELLEHLEDLKFARGCVYRLRMAVNYDELPNPSRMALRISRAERELGKLLEDLRAAWE